MDGEVISPVGWYAVTYAEVYTLLREDGNSGPTDCLIHENTVLVKAQCPTEAYDKCEREYSRLCDGDYKDTDDESIRYRGSYGGILYIHVMVEEPGDLSEVLSLKDKTTTDAFFPKVRCREDVIDSADTYGG